MNNMKKSRILIGVILFYTQISCHVDKKYDYSTTFSLSDFPLIEKLDTVNMNCTPFLSIPIRMLCMDSILLVQNRKNEFFLQRYSIPSLQPKGIDCIAFGHGPEEMLSVHRIQIQDSLLWLSDKMGQSCMGYHRSDIVNKADLASVRKVHFELPFYDISPLVDSGFVATVLHPEHKRLSFFDFEGNCYATKGEYPDFGVKHSPLEQIESYVCEISIDNKNKRIWLFYTLTDLIEIYNFNGDLIKRMHGPDIFFPSMKEVSMDDGYQKVSSIEDETRDAYFCPLMSGGKMYVLYSGKVFTRARPLSAYLLNKLMVFDLDGKPFKCYELSVPIFTFAIDESNNVLYGLSFDPEYHLVKYIL